MSPRKDSPPERKTGSFTKFSGFNLSVGCFGPTFSKITPNGQIWDFTGSRYDSSAPNYVARLFYFEKIKTNYNMAQKNSKMLMFVKKEL